MYLEGALQTRKWQDREGQDRYSTEIVLQKFRGELQMLDARGQGGGEMSEYSGGGSNYGGGRRGGSDFGQSSPSDDRGGRGGGGGNFSRDLDDEIPF